VPGAISMLVGEPVLRKCGSEFYILNSTTLKDLSLTVQAKVAQRGRVRLPNVRAGTKSLSSSVR